MIKKLLLVFIPVISILLNSCNSSSEDVDKVNISNITSEVKTHSYSNYKSIFTKHLHLDLDINFENKTIYGVARHEMINKGVDTAIFDIKALDIQKVTLGPKEAEIETDFVIGKNDELLGQPLFVKLKDKANLVNIYYKTTEKTEALDWLDPKLTAGKKYPFMYSQGESILTRSWIPLQDVPSIRLTYSADVTAPKDLLVLMSAENPMGINHEGKYHFEMRQPISSYLIAIAAGNIAFRSLGKNCGIYAEPELINKCTWEFVDLSKMIGAAEEIYGEYKWDRYDILMLPYSFPFGGMENPRLTFANPTLIAGDRSLTSVIAHELAHSWSGNLVTNSAWEDFWLNEGFTVYFENRIMEKLYGKEVADMLSIIEFQELKNEMEVIEHGDFPEDTKLKLSLDLRNPDDGMTSVAYVKGAFFLKSIEAKVGRATFDEFLKKYFNHFAFKTVSTEIFEDYLNKELLSKNNIDFNTREWLYEKGLPENCLKIYSKRFENVQKLARDYANGKNIFKVRRKKDRITREKFITQEWMAFIRALPQEIDVELLKKLDSKLDFKGWGNSEIVTEWYLLGIKNEYKGIRPQLRRFLTKIGRRKYIAPLFEALTKNEDDLIWAKKVFTKVKDNYHYLTRQTVEEILYPEKHVKN